MLQTRYRIEFILNHEGLICRVTKMEALLCQRMNSNGLDFAIRINKASILLSLI